MKIKLLFTVAVICLSLGVSKQAQASHAMGADLSYECLGGDSFRVTLNLYRDCAGIDAPTSATINFSSGSCSIGSLTYTLPLVGVAQEVSSLCPTSLPQSTCNGGSLPGVEQYIYADVIVVPAQCSDWVISYTLCCRNDQITTLLTPGSYDLYVESTMNNTAGLCDNSPVFTSLPVPYVCAGQQFNYNHGAIDLDGDSLVYSLIAPLDGPGVSIPYTGGLGPNNPMNATGSFVFNSVTGQMTFTPSVPQVAVVAVLVQEYRNGVLIGSTIRDIQVVVIACNNNQPVVTGIQNQTGGATRDSLTAEVCPDETISFQFTASDPDVLNNLTMTSNVAQAIPGGIFDTTITGNTVTGTFTWMPTPLDTGVNVFTVTVIDGACPIFGTAVVSFQIYVLDGTSAGPDVRYCPAGGPVQLNALGGNNFVWTPDNGLSDDSIRNPLASPTATTDYVVVSDLSGFCKNIDTVRVFVVPDFILSVSPDDTICRNGSTTIAVNTDPLWAPYTYQWSPTSSVFDASAASTTAFPFSTTTYDVVVTSDTGCTIRDTVTVFVNGVGPIVEITADRNNVCPGDTVQLTGQIFPLDCGETLTGCSAQNLPIAKTYGSGTTSTFTGTPFAGASEDVRYQALYLASDLIASGIGPGTITRIELEVGSKASTGVYQNLTIKLGCTGNNSLSTDQWEPANTVVFGPAVFSTSTGINSFPLSVPYDWDGRTNLVLEICFNNPALASAGGNDQLMSVTPTNTYNASMRATSNNTDGCTLNPTFVYAEIPRTIFHICDPLVSNYTFFWTPTAGLSNPTIINPKAGVSGIQLYTLNVSDSLCEGSGYIIVNVDTNYSIDATPDTTLCGGGQVQLNVAVLGSPPSSTLPCGANGTQCSSASNVRQMGTGATGSGTGTPYEGFWEDGRVQYLYRASELQAAGLTASGTITALAFFVTQKASSQPYEGYTIKMACTGLPTLPSTSFVTAGFSTVYGPISYNTTSGWNTHTLSNPYDWDGVSNIIVEICFNNLDWTDDDEVAVTFTPGYNSVLYDFTDGAIGCNLNGPAATSDRANTRFTFCNAPAGSTSILWTPYATLSDSVISNPLASPPASITYTVAYTFVDGCTRYDSVTVDVTSFITTISPDPTICSGDSAQLVAGGGTNYLWDTIPGLSCYTCPNPFASPDTTTKYFVNITDSLGTCLKVDSVTVTVLPKPAISFSNDTLYCFIGSFTLDAGAGYADYDWSTGASTQTITGITAGWYAVTVTDTNGCTNADSIQMTLNPPPTVNLGADVVRCAGDSVTLDAGAGFVAYSWNTTSTIQTITIFTSGDYVVTVTDANSCPAIDTATITFNSPDVDLGNDAILCAGVSLILNAGNANNTYLWNDSSTNATLIVSQQGTYSVTATDANSCTDVDSVTLGYFPDAPVDLGPDTVTCNNRSISFNAGAGYTSYLWSTGSAAQAISTALPGTYRVTATDVNNCPYSDTITLSDITPTVSIGGDRTICQGDTVVFDAGAGFTTYAWSNGLSTQSITVSTANVYTVTVTSTNACTTTDNVRVIVNSLPQPNLGSADSVCPGYIIYPGNFETYEWSDNSTDSILIVNFTGNYCVTVSDVNSCVNSACIDLLVYELNLFVSDVLLCEQGDSATLSAPADLVFYQWSTGATTQTITVTNPGTYSVTVQNVQGCIGSDSGEVFFDSMSVVASASPVLIGANDSSILNANVINGSGAYTFNWTPAETIDDATAQSPQATPASNTIYLVEVTDAETGCTATDTVLVIVDSKFTFPDAFTPNGDGQNDFFKPIKNESVVVKEFRIYNRWGQVISEDVNGWDGKFEGKEQSVGTYTYYVVAQLANGETKTQSGVFSLLR